MPLETNRNSGLPILQKKQKSIESADSFYPQYVHSQVLTYEKKTANKL